MHAVKCQGDDDDDDSNNDEDEDHDNDNDGDGKILQSVNLINGCNCLNLKSKSNEDRILVIMMKISYLGPLKIMIMTMMVMERCFKVLI